MFLKSTASDPELHPAVLRYSSARLDEDEHRPELTVKGVHSVAVLGTVKTSHPPQPGYPNSRSVVPRRFFASRYRVQVAPSAGMKAVG